MDGNLRNRNDALAAGRKGLGVVELLVVVSVIGLLLALALPALQAARESARRTHCNSNLREVGHAMLQFEQAKGHLPSGGKGIDVSARPPMVAFDLQSTFTQLVPYFEESYSGRGVQSGIRL